MLADDDVPSWRTLAEWQVSRYSNLDPIELSDRVVRYRDQFRLVRNSFLAATATRQLVGLESARATAQSQAVADAVEGMAKLSLADPREAIGWMMQSAILLLRAGQHRDALDHPRLGATKSDHPCPSRSGRCGRATHAGGRDALDDEGVAGATVALASCTLRQAIDFTSAALAAASQVAPEQVSG